MAARRPRQAPDPEGPGLFDAVPGAGAQPRSEVPSRSELEVEVELEAGIEVEAEVSVRSGARTPQAPQPITVGALTRAIQGRLTELGPLAVEGELSGLKRASSGHVYFDLKDEGGKAKVSCVVWRSQVERALRPPPSDGMRVVVRGRLDVYAPRGSYSLIVERVEARGIGELLARLEELKGELRGLGWFDRRRPLPRLPRCIGVVTSRDGAALRDFLRTRTHRWPLYPVRLAHAPVQGPGAARQIAGAIGELDASGVDVIVVTRGGGSLEDLWAFNERVVAEAIWRASVPVVSAVGHESDVALSDLVADHRAHTPTDAAQTAIPDRRAYLERLERAGGYLSAAAAALLERRAERLDALRRSRVLRRADWILEERERGLLHAWTRLSHRLERRLSSGEGRARELFARLERVSPRARVEQWMARLGRAALRLRSSCQRRLDGADARIAGLSRGLDAISPLRVLGRGYSLTSVVGREGLLRDAGAVSPGDELETRLARGRIRSRVLRSGGGEPAGRSEDGKQPE